MTIINFWMIFLRTFLSAAADATESMNMFELRGKQIRVGRAMFPPPQIINSGPETNFTRTSAARVRV